MPTIYNPMLLFYPTPQAKTDMAVQSLLHGFRLTLQAVPLLAGVIKAMPDGTAQVGTLAIASSSRAVDQIFWVKDLRKSKEYNYFEQRKKGFPPSSFPIWNFVHLEYFADSHPPVMHVQVTLIDGGLVLAPCIHHSFADGIGTASILKIWAACCRAEVIVKEEISCLWQSPSVIEGNQQVSLEEFPQFTYKEKTGLMNRRPPMGSADQRNRLTESRLVSALTHVFEAFFKPMFLTLAIFVFTKYQSLTLSTRLIHFSDADLAGLKENVQAAGGGLDDKTWISTMDALSALLFCCAAQSRFLAKHKPSTSPKPPQEEQSGTLWNYLMGWLHRIIPARRSSPPPSPPEDLALFMTAVDVRKHCQPPLPPDYIRNMLLSCYIQSPVHELTPSMHNLVLQARRLRARLRALDSEYVGRVAAAIRSAPDVSKISSTGGECPEKSLTLTSWREQDSCNFDWGPHLGGKCERVRVCNILADGLVIVFPRNGGSKPDGGLDIALGLRKDAMRELEKNEFFNRFARWH